jgi:hypothetical protein
MVHLLSLADLHKLEKPTERLILKEKNNRSLQKSIPSSIRQFVGSDIWFSRKILIVWQWDSYIAQETKKACLHSIHANYK